MSLYQSRQLGANGLYVILNNRDHDRIPLKTALNNHPSVVEQFRWEYGHQPPVDADPNTTPSSFTAETPTTISWQNREFSIDSCSPNQEQVS